MTTQLSRTQVNPWPWSIPLGYAQAQRVTGAQVHLLCAGQTAVDAQGAPQHPGDMRAQLALALDNLGAVLAAGGLGWADIVRLQVFATDVDAALQNFDLLGMRLGAAGAAPAMTLVGVTRLAIPGLMIELEATAMA